MLDRLQKYRAKRDFKKTAEPAGARKPAIKGRSYLIQKHAASRLHYDFRLEHNGVLLSWAIPKGPSLNPEDKRLAVQVEDHPLEYGSFEGTIPKGQYGGGTVMLWDRGTWEPHGDVDEGLKKGKLAFTLHGERLTGNWALIRLRGRPGDRGKNNWLLIKEKDDEVRTKGPALVDREITSVATGREMEEIAQGSDVWRSNRAEKGSGGKKAKEKKSGRAASGSKKKSETRAAETGSAKTGARKIPPFVPPQLATLVDAPPEGTDCLHEIKYDGYRAVTSIGGGSVIVRTRNGLDWTDKFQPLVGPLSGLPCDSALLDGEIAVADAEGHTSFSALQVALSEGRGTFGYYIFDLLHLNGKDLRARPLIERKKLLEKLLSAAPEKGPLFYSSHLTGQGQQIFHHACDLKLEGIISKRARDPYRSGRTKSWLKTKCGMEQEFVIVGWQPSDKAARPFRSILLAVREEGELRYVGRVGSGYSEARLDELAARFKKYARKAPPVKNVPHAFARHARWVEPVLVAEVAFRGWTHDGMIRQGSFKGLREDKPASVIVRERPMPKAQAVKIAHEDKDEIEGVHITHPDRVVFPDQGVTKRELIEYYVAVADHMLPYIEGRPLALVRCPQGRGKECFFQKHASPGWPDLFGKIRIKEKSGSDEYMYIEDVRGLVGAAQMGVLELHIWGSRVDDVEKPDRMVFDLDPDEGLAFAKVKEAARDFKKRLEKIGLESFPMITGGKGVHVVVPLARKHSWDQHRAFAEAMARLMADEDPGRYVANMAKKKRTGKIFIDYLRNQRGSTAIAPFSTRARKGAYVALPVSWAGLARLENAHPASIKNAVKLFGRGKDPWAGYHKVKQALPLGKGKG
jgi:bifunctional non-homologous end joining protein LigD